MEIQSEPIYSHSDALQRQMERQAYAGDTPITSHVGKRTWGVPPN
jgi:hypothetical protein